ncbi:DUF4355 domain-containing protein [Salinicoccus roseus]|uniref:DUF4355 domain-containing protein n=1 Tax=Salinicoccus roseus TaxID=45670 RepID=UPI002301F92A|nr:DUF4355 domain-containing protein [Salinicoccus roseus]
MEKKLKDYLEQRMPYRLNLQHFAEGGDGEGGSTDDGTSVEGEGAGEGGETTYTRQQVDSMISKGVASAIDKKKKEWDKELEKRLEDERKKAADYAQLSEKEKKDRDLQDREKQLADRERELNMKELEAQVTQDLKDEGLPTSFAQTLVTLESNEVIKETISNIKKDFDQAVNDKVKEVTRQDTPVGGTGQLGSDKTTKSITQLAREKRIIK